MRWFYQSIFLSWGLITSPAWSHGGHVGNGGNGVVCRDSESHIESVEMLDYFQYRDLLHYDLGPTEWDYARKINYVLDRLVRVDPARAKKYRADAANFIDLVRWVPQPLESVPDSGFVPVPAHCRIEQMAIQFQAALADGKRYLVAVSLWAELDEENRAGLILHEIIYREAIALGHEDSFKVRYYNAVLASLELNDMDQKTYDNFSSLTFAKVSKFKFKSDSFSLSSTEGGTHLWDLNQLLINGSGKKIVWFLNPTPPAWAELDGAKGQLRLKAPPKGIFPFSLVARDGAAGAITQLRIIIN